MENEEIVRNADISENFTIVGNNIIKDDRLSIEARFVLIYMRSFKKGWVFYKKDLQERLKIGRRVIDRCFEELSDVGYLVETELIKTGSLFPTKGYTVYPFSIKDEPITLYSTDVQNVQRSVVSRVQNVHLINTNNTNNTYTDKSSSDSIPINQGTDKPEEHKEGGGGGPAAAKSDVEKAKDYLKESMLPYKDKYSREMLNEFFLYWTEGSQKNNKIRYQDEKFFDVGRRLATWANNNKKKFGEQTPVSKPMHNIKFNIQ